MFKVLSYLVILLPCLFIYSLSFSQANLSQAYAGNYLLKTNFIEIFDSIKPEVVVQKKLTTTNIIASFTAPDTVCINNPVTIANTSTGASTYFWNFCVADIDKTPIAAQLGNPNNALAAPVFMDYAYVNGNYYGFSTNFNPGGLVRLDFGNSLLNTPTAVNLGNFGGIIPISSGAEGLQVVQNEGKWYVIMVGGNPLVPGGVTPRVLKVELGTDITNPAPVATSWGNLGNMLQPIDLHLFKDGSDWYGFTVNSENHTITRFNFTNSFDNVPTAVNLGNIGNLAYPTGIYVINDNGNYLAFITNGGDNTRNTHPNWSLSRLDFGNSLLNTPTGANLGSLGGVLRHPRDLTIMRSCDQIVAFAVNGAFGSSDLVKLNFNNNLSSVPTATSLGNFGFLNFPHSISKLFRVNEDIYGFVTNVSNNTITRLRFPGCANASIASSTLETPPPITYNTPGTYNINLTIDDGLPTQTAFCKQVVVLPAPVASPTKVIELCEGEQIKIGTGTKSATYLWNTGDMADSIIVTGVGTYWVEVNRFGCQATDTFKVISKRVADFSFKQDVCNPHSLEFINASSATIDPWWDLGDGTIQSGNTSLVHVFPAFGDYKVRFSISDGICADTIEKVITVAVQKENIILTSDTIICDGTSKQLRAASALSYCWFPTIYLDNPTAQNPVTNTPEDITYYLHTQAIGNNLITNGDFSAGNTGFSSDYVYAANNTTEGQYGIGPNPQLWNPGTNNCSDHTTGNGNMLMVNGNPVADQKVWYTTIAITPNTNFAFSCWVQSIHSTNPARLQFFINGKLLGDIFSASATTCQWQQFYEVWNSGNATTAEIAIVNQNTLSVGNDFALDDISFAPVFIKHDSVVIKVEKPLVKASNDTTVCSDKTVPLSATGAASYSWSPVTGLSDPAVANPVATPGAGSTQYIVTGTTANGCVAKDTVMVNTFPQPAITKTQDTLVCGNTTFPLFIEGGVSYAWTSSSGQLSDANTDRPNVSVGTAPVTYKVTITDSHACESFDSVQIAVRPYPVFSAISDQAICEGSSQVMHASGGDVYQWSPAAWLDDASAPSPVAKPAATTQFSVYIQESSCGYDTTINMLLTVNPVPELTIDKTNDINCNTPTAQLSVSGAMRYTWSPLAGLDDPTKANPVVSIDATTKYEVKGVNQFGCSSTAFVEVKVNKDGIPSFVVPSAFTPNGDRNNDCFGIKRWGNAIVHEFTVYNRWGQQVFKTNNPNQCWDGTFKGKPQDTGGYVYVICARTLCGEITHKGVVMLIR